MFRRILCLVHYITSTLFLIDKVVRKVSRFEGARDKRLAFEDAVSKVLEKLDATEDVIFNLEKETQRSIKDRILLLKVICHE